MKKIFITFSSLLIVSLFFTVSTGAGKDSSGYTGSGECQSCHEEIYASWKSSKHAGEFGSADDPFLTCNGCHNTGRDFSKKSSIENKIGCEACHGPGEEHIKSEGDKNKIVSSHSADTCGRCHNQNFSGNNTEWMKEYRHGKKLSDIKALKLIPVDPEKLPLPINGTHPYMIYNMWLVSGHGSPPERDIKIGGKNWTEPISCVICHNPHYSDNPSQLVMKAEDLCRSCHFQGAVLKGFGANGIEETRSLHTAAPCISCHMTEKNHLMKMLRPDDPDLSEDRVDSCSACHEVKDRKMRSDQLQDMEAWYNETMEPIQNDLEFIEKKLKENPDILNAGLEKKLKDVKDNLFIIVNDRSNGVHNLDYALEIMYLAKRQLKEIKKAVE